MTIVKFKPKNNNDQTMMTIEFEDKNIHLVYRFPEEDQAANSNRFIQALRELGYDGQAAQIGQKNETETFPGI